VCLLSNLLRGKKLTENVSISFIVNILTRQFPQRHVYPSLLKKWWATISASHNLFMRCDPFFNQLAAQERQLWYFQQDNATAHTANATMVTIREVFED
jgi:glycerol uptake facilitator-like aquaporin